MVSRHLKQDKGENSKDSGSICRSTERGRTGHCQARAKHCCREDRCSVSHVQDTFRQRLKYKAGLLNKVVVEQDESYTSQACFRCGHLKKDLGPAKTYLCRECALVITTSCSVAHPSTTQRRLLFWASASRNIHTGPRIRSLK